MLLLQVARNIYKSTKGAAFSRFNNIVDQDFYPPVSGEFLPDIFTFVNLIHKKSTYLPIYYCYCWLLSIKKMNRILIRYKCVIYNVNC